MNIFIVNRLKPINQTLPVVVFHAALHYVRLFLAEKLGQLLRLCVHHHLPFYLGLYVDILSLLAFSAPGMTLFSITVPVSPSGVPASRPTLGICLRMYS